jgi:single-strand DNA-binding protein
MARSVNHVILIGNLTRDPELRYTATGKPVCDIGLATSRQWKTETGEKKEETEYHRIVLWGKLGETASQYLKKGEKAYFQGRLRTRSYTGQDGTEKKATEIVAEEMVMLSGAPNARPASEPAPAAPAKSPKEELEDAAASSQQPDSTEPDTDEIPF